GGGEGVVEAAVRRVAAVRLAGGEVHDAGDVPRVVDGGAGRRGGAGEDAPVVHGRPVPDEGVADGRRRAGAPRHPAAVVDGVTRAVAAPAERAEVRERAAR